MSQSPAFPLPPLPPPQFVGVDTPCRNCSYNLRTLPTSALCPECGMSIALSLRSDLLRFSNPDWLILLRRGMICSFIGTLGMLILSYAFGRILPMGGGIGVVEQALAEALALGGTWIITTPDPGGLGEDQYGPWRRAVRLLVVLRGIDWIAQRGITTLAMSSAAARNGIPLQFLFMISYLLSSALAVAEMGYLARLAARLPNVALTMLARTLMFLMPAVLVSTGAILFCVRLPKIPRGALSHLHVALGLAFLGNIMITLIYLRLISRWRRELNGEIQVAKIRWANPTAIPPAP
jgi:hypothetical protein